MTRKQKKLLLQISVSVLLFATALIIIPAGALQIAVYLASFFAVGYSVLFKALKNICHMQIFDENFLMSLATAGAIAIGEYPEAVFVMMFYQIGQLFESVAVGKSRKSITKLMDLRPDYANVERDGNIIMLSPEEVAVGETVIVRPGEKIPVDAIVIEGQASISTAALTGEPLPRVIAAGDSVISGCININGVIKIRTEKLYEESTASKILQLVEQSAAAKSKSESFISKFAKHYTPVVVLLASFFATVIPLFVGEWNLWIYRALSFLVISCPCALVISVPLSFFAGIGGASKRGILIKGSCYLEKLASCGTAVFDKTGTLTEGSFTVTEVYSETMNESQLVELAAFAEYHSNHPISLSIKKYYGDNIDKKRITKITEIAGKGISAIIDGRDVYVGNARLMDDICVKYRECNEFGTVIHIAAENDSGIAVYEGYILVSDNIKPKTEKALADLKKIGIKKTVMLSGDSEKNARHIGEKLMIDEIRGELLPSDKVSELEHLLVSEAKNGNLIFVGDGINDAPVLSRADIGIAMGVLGSDAAIESADVVIMDDDLSRLPLALKIAQKTKSIVNQNIVFSLTVKFAVLILSVFGLCNMWEAVFADVGVTVIAVFNAMRAMNISKIWF